MRLVFRTVLTVIVTALLSFTPVAASPSDERHSPKVGSVASPTFEITLDPRLQAPPGSNADPVGDGIAIGALIGAGTGLALMRWAYAQCDGSCDAPEPAPMYLMAAGVSAAVGGVVGWLIDASRKNASQRVAVNGVALPKRAAVRVSVRW